MQNRVKSSEIERLHWCEKQVEFFDCCKELKEV